MRRVAVALKAIAPGAQFPTPMNGTGAHAPIFTNLGKRVQEKMVAAASMGQIRMPFLCAAPETGQPDRITPLGEGLDDDTINLMIVGYCGGIGVPSTDAYVTRRQALDALADDVMVAMLAVPYITDSDHPTPLLETVGAIAVVCLLREVQEFDDVAWGALEMRFALRYNANPFYS